MNKNSFKENVVVITGASAGIGEKLALQLSDCGAFLSLAARDESKLNDIAAKCRNNGAKVLVVQTDVSEKTQCENLIKKTIAEFGRIDTLINNAGITMWAGFDQLKDISLLEKIMQVNYFGSVYCTYYALPYLKNSNGRIVGISSLTGKTGVPTRTGYSASKHAMAGFFDSLRIELMNSGVTVTMIYPGFVATEVRERAFGADGKPLGISHIDEKNVMTADECAKQIIDAAGKRKRELVMTTKAKIGLWMKMINPEWVDRTSLKMINKGK
jgi:short-subunit dehydrogenase